RLGARLPQGLPARNPRHDPARLAQHGRGRAAVRRRHPAAGRPRVRSRRAERSGRTLRARGHGGGVPRHGARPPQGAGVMSGSIQRIWALVLRHINIWRSSVMRLVDSIYWPAVQMVMWGFMTQYLLPQASFVAQAAGVLLSGLLLWEVVVRGNLSLSIAFLEEMWSRNLGHLFVSPIRSWEMATGIIIAALLRTLLGLVPVSLMAWAFFGYN